MIAAIQHALAMINLRIFLFSILLFFVGYTLAPFVYYRRFKLLLAYPLWVARKLDDIARKNWRPLVLFAFIFTMNLLSLFVDLISGYVPALPFVFAVWTGLNIGVVTYHTLEGKFYYISLLNPVAIFELPAAFVAFSLAIEFNCHLLNCTVFNQSVSAFQPFLQSFAIIVIPLLIIAGIIETFAIRLANKVEEEQREAESKEDKDNDQKED